MQKMSDEEDFDEFPSITVNSSIHESSSFSMPSAEELATQRAREEACELELLRLREEQPQLAGDPQDAAAQLAHSDSSGSEAEAALRTAVGALRVRPAAGPAPGATAARLLAALAPRLAAPARARAAFLRLAAAPGSRGVRALAPRLAGGVARAALAGDAAPGDLSAAGAWLCCAALVPGAGRGALRALHALVEREEPGAGLAELVRGAAGALEPAAALELSDALRSGGARGDELARAVARAALARLADADGEWCMERIAERLPGAWRRLAAPQRYLALQLLARLLPPQGEGPAGEEAGPGQGEGRAARRLLDALVQTTAPQRAQTTDELKVLVAATKLDVLFHVKK